MLTVKQYLELDHKIDKTEEDKQAIVEYNKELITLFPFLIPTNAFTGLTVDDYDYTWTELDAMPEGWRIAFGMKLCEDIKKALLKAQKNDPKGGYLEKYYTTNTESDRVLPYLEGYHPTQIKEKYGELRWYDNGAPGDVSDVIDEYTFLSRVTCINCGKPAKYISKGWISPYCEDCADKMLKENGHIDDDSFEDYFTTVDEFFEEDID